MSMRGSGRVSGGARRSRRLLSRSRFAIVSPSERTESYSSPELAWQHASLEDRRRLLALAIEKVIMVPWPGGRKNPKGEGCTNTVPSGCRIVFVQQPSKTISSTHRYVNGGRHHL